MKKFLCLFIVFVAVFSFPIAAIATDYNNFSIEAVVERFEDGSYITEEILEETNLSRATNYTSGSKVSRYYASDDTLLWKITLTGSFSYNGTSANCTNADIVVSIYDSKWKCTESSATEVSAQARGSATLKKYVLGLPVDTIERSLILKCSPDGTLS